jgi:enoyl-CoA hydratase/carnithine racemase
MNAPSQESPAILLTRQDGVVTLTLNRPDTRNALSGEQMFSAFEERFNEINSDPSIACVILTGAGSAFCSGGNIADMHTKTGMFEGSAEEVTLRYRNGIQRIPLAFQTLLPPIIAAVNGAAVGAGCDLASMCDIRIAATTAVFAESFVRLGIIPGDGGCWFLPRIVGHSKAAELALTGETITALEALNIGLVSKVVEKESLLSAAMELAQKIASNPRQTVRWTKQLLQHSANQTLQQALVEASRLQGLAHQTPDHAEAVAAFFEKRAPKFKI